MGGRTSREPVAMATGVTWWPGPFSSGAASTGAIPLGVRARAIELRVTAPQDPNLRLDGSSFAAPDLVRFYWTPNSRPRLAGTLFLTCIGGLCSR
jgi:hypothetical protein